MPHNFYELKPTATSTATCKSMTHLCTFIFLRALTSVLKTALPWTWYISAWQTQTKQARETFWNHSKVHYVTIYAHRLVVRFILVFEANINRRNFAHSHKNCSCFGSHPQKKMEAGSETENVITIVARRAGVMESVLRLMISLLAGTYSKAVFVFINFFHCWV